MPDYVAFGAAQAQIGARQIAGEITEAEAAAEYAAAATALNLQGPFLTVQQALTAFKGRLSDMVIGEGPPAAETGRPGVMYWDSLVPAIYGPKGDDPVDPWGPGVALKGADGRVVEMRRAGAQVQWRLVGDADWTDLLPLSDITPAFEIGTVTTGEPGSSAAASISGPPSAPALNLTVPRGDAGEGDVTGPASSVDARVALFDGPTGKLLKVGPSLADYRRLADLLNISDVDGLASALAARLDADQVAAAIAALRGAAGGLASLDDDGVLPLAQAGAALITDVDVVDSEAAMLALTHRHNGDVCIRTDLSRSFILKATPASTLANWQELLAPTTGVTSLAGASGDISAASARSLLQVLALAGGTMTGKLTLKASFTDNLAQLNIPDVGTTNPATLSPGDIFGRSNALYRVRNDGTALIMYDSGNLQTPSQAEIEAGAANTARIMSALRVRQGADAAIVAGAMRLTGASPMTGKLTLKASDTASASLNIPSGPTPTTLADGDIWYDVHFRGRRSGSTLTIWDTGNLTMVTQADAEAGVSTSTRLWTAERVTQAIKAQARPPLMIALSDETTAITTGVKATIRAAEAMTIDALPRISVNTASSSGLVTVDIKINGVSIFTTKPTIDASEKTSVTAATAASLTASTISVADDAEITFEVTVAGTGAKGLKATLYWRRAS